MKINTCHTFCRNYIKSIAVFILICALCFMPGNSTKTSIFANIPHFDKWVHFGLFFVFAFSISSDISKVLKVQKKQIILIICLFSALLGGGIELVQHFFIPSRSGDIYDFFADIAGSLVFILTLIFLGKKKNT